MQAQQMQAQVMNQQQFDQQMAQPSGSFKMGQNPYMAQQ
jgi:hypothetical protein